MLKPLWVDCHQRQPEQGCSQQYLSPQNHRVQNNQSGPSEPPHQSVGYMLIYHPYWDLHNRYKQEPDRHHQEKKIQSQDGESHFQSTTCVCLTLTIFAKLLWSTYVLTLPHLIGQQYSDPESSGFLSCLCPYGLVWTGYKDGISMTCSQSLSVKLNYIWFP